MGVDSKLVLPANVEVEKVAKVMGVLAGLKPERYEIERSDGLFVRVPGVTVAPTTLAQMAQITLQPPDGEKLVDGDQTHWCPYHFEHQGKRLISGRSTAFWIALFCRVADFFGGSVDYNDCDDREWNYRVKAKSNDENCPQDNEPWDDLHRRILELQPLTSEELEHARQFAAYPER